MDNIEIEEAADVWAEWKALKEDLPERRFRQDY
jgi:hypothetical protein